MLCVKDTGKKESRKGKEVILHCCVTPVTREVLKGVCQEVLGATEVVKEGKMGRARWGLCCVAVLALGGCPCMDAGYCGLARERERERENMCVSAVTSGPCPMPRGLTGRTLSPLQELGLLWTVVEGCVVQAISLHVQGPGPTQPLQACKEDSCEEELRGSSQSRPPGPPSMRLDCIIQPVLS